MGDDWTHARIRKGLLAKINDFLETPEAKDLGLTNATQTIDLALRNLLREYYKKRFEHINMYEDKIRVLDNQIGKNGDIVTVFFKDKKGWCGYCESVDCVHLKYIFSQPELAMKLKHIGIKSPF